MATGDSKCSFFCGRYTSLTRSPWTTLMKQVQGPLKLTSDRLPKMDYFNFNKSSSIISQKMVYWSSPRTRDPRNVFARSFVLIYRSLSFPTFTIVLEWRSTFFFSEGLRGEKLMKYGTSVQQRQTQ